MRRSPLLATLAVAAAVAPTIAAAPARPSLGVLDRTPLTVSGRAFEARETVRVRLSTRGRTLTRRAVAGAAGAFTLRFSISLGRCDSLSLQAFGSAGSRARLFATAPQPACTSTG